jgi:AcrR family transcriptional regulator
MRKGEQTRGQIVGTALEVASVEGFDGLSIGDLASRLGLSKSGLFAHFGSKEALQLAVLDEGVARFVTRAVRPALARPAGLPRLEALAENLLAWIEDPGLPGGCPMLAAALEHDDRPGPLRDRLQAEQTALRATFARAVRGAAERGHLHPATPADRLAFGIVALAYGYGVQRRFLDAPEAGAMARAAVADLLRPFRTPACAAGPAPAG